MDYINNKWYPAYAFHKFPDANDIINKPFDSYDEALNYVENLLVDDDAIDAFYYHNGWYRLWEI